MKRRGYNRRRFQRGRHGFTLVEIMVAVVILAIGLLGMAAMTIMVIRGNRMAVRQTNATNLAQQLMERLKDVPFASLGSDGACGSIVFGWSDYVCVEEVDAQGQPAPSGPFTYKRYLRVCDSSSDDSGFVVSALDHCNNMADLSSAQAGVDNVTAELGCTSSLNVGEKQIRIVVATSDPQRGCLDVGLDTVVVQSF